MLPYRVPVTQHWAMITFILLRSMTTIIDFNVTNSSGVESVSSAGLTVDLSGASSKNITVDYVVTGSAIGSGTDYTLANGTLTINAGETSGTITIDNIVDDSLYEPNETIIVTLSNPSNATLGSENVHTYTITDNDSKPVVAFDVKSSNGAESVSSKTITVGLSSVSGNYLLHNLSNGTLIKTGSTVELLQLILLMIT